MQRISAHCSTPALSATRRNRARGSGTLSSSTSAAASAFARHFSSTSSSSSSSCSYSRSSSLASMLISGPPPRPFASATATVCRVQAVYHAHSTLSSLAFPSLHSSRSFSLSASAPTASTAASAASSASSVADTASAAAIDVQSVAAQALAANPDVAVIATQAVVASSHNFIVTGAQALLESIHVSMGLPWYGTIMFVTVAIRAALLYLYVRQQRISARMVLAKKDTDALQAEMNAAKKNGGLSGMEQQQKSAELARVFKKHGIEFKWLLAYPAATVPIFMTFFFALRSMAERCPDFLTGGFYLVSNLGAPHPLVGCLAGASMGLVVYFGNEFGNNMDPKMSTIQKWMGFISSCVIAYAGSFHFPAGVSVYWLASNLVALATAYFFRKPAVKKFFDIPLLPKQEKKKEEQTAQQALLEEFKGVELVKK